MRATVRHTAAAVTTGAFLALLFDAVLQLLAGAIRVTGGVRPLWYAGVAEHSVWIALGLILWLAAPLLGEWIDDVVPGAQVSRRTVWELVGLGLLALPPCYLLAQWIVIATQFSISGTWHAAGGTFLSSAYYGAVLLSITPMAGSRCNRPSLGAPSTPGVTCRRAEPTARSLGHTMCIGAALFRGWFRRGLRAISSGADVQQGR